MAVFNISCNQVWAFWTSPLGPRKRVCMCVSYWACLISSVTRFVHHHWGCLYRYTRTARLRNLIWQPNLPSLSLYFSLFLSVFHTEAQCQSIILSPIPLHCDLLLRQQGEAPAQHPIIHQQSSPVPCQRLIGWANEERWKLSPEEMRPIGNMWYGES